MCAYIAYILHQHTLPYPRCITQTCGSPHSILNHSLPHSRRDRLLYLQSNIFIIPRYLAPHSIHNYSLPILLVKPPHSRSLWGRALPFLNASHMLLDIFHLSVAQVFCGSPSSWFWSWSCFTSVRELSPPGNGWWPRNIYDTGHSPRHSQPLLWKSKLFTPSIIYLSLDTDGFGTINGDVMVTVLVLKTI